MIHYCEKVVMIFLHFTYDLNHDTFCNRQKINGLDQYNTGVFNYLFFYKNNLFTSRSKIFLHLKKNYFNRYSKFYYIVFKSVLYDFKIKSSRNLFPYLVLVC